MIGRSRCGISDFRYTLICWNNDTDADMLTQSLAPDFSSQLKSCVQEAHERLRSEPRAEALFARATTAFMRELLDMGPSLARQAAAPDAIGHDDKTLLAELMIQALRDDPLSSKETRLRLQGQLAFRRLLEESGGAYTAAEVAALLNITEDAVRKRTRKAKLLVVPQGQHSIYPAFQFNGGTLVRGLDATLALLETESAPAKVRFFLSADSDLQCTPLEALRSSDPKQHSMVRRKAGQFGRHVAR